jgi:hypothetical protein
MHELTDQELYEAIEYARNIDEDTGRSIVEKFQIEQAALAQTIFNIFPSLIAQQNQDMATIFMELCFDTLCVYEHAFGNVPPQSEAWLEQQMALLDVEFQSLIPEQQMDEKIRSRLKNRFSERALNEVTQLRLIEVKNESIDDFAAENTARVPTVKFTQTMIFTVIRLFSNLYAQTAKP